MTFDKPFDRITVEDGKMGGQPCIRGYRFTVQRCSASSPPTPTTTPVCELSLPRRRRSRPGARVCRRIFPLRSGPRRLSEVLLDQSVPARTSQLLRDLGYDAVHASEVGMQTAPDLAYLERGAADGSIVVTMDAHFHGLLAEHNMVLPSTIRLRIHNPNEFAATQAIHAMCLRYEMELRAGCAISYRSESHRIRPLPLKK